MLPTLWKNTANCVRYTAYDIRLNIARDLEHRNEFIAPVQGKSKGN